jgi:hypothetical protein
MAYAAARYGNTPATTRRVMDAIKNGTEDGLLTPGQRSRDRHKSHGSPGQHRQTQRARKREHAARLLAIRTELPVGKGVYTPAPKQVPIEDGAPWSKFDADVRGDIAALARPPYLEDVPLAGEVL